MLRTSWKITALILLFGLLTSTKLVFAQDTFVSDVQIRYEFAQWAEISGKIDPRNLPEKVTLFLQPEHQSSRQIEILPNSDGNFQVEYNLDLDPLVPFSRVYYWFQLDFSNNQSSTSPSFWFDYLDNRYDWNSISSKLFEVFWIGESADYGQKVIDLSTKGMETATRLLALAPELPIRIFIYPDSSSLQDTLTLTHQPWVAGHASPDLGVILVSNDAGNDQLFELERQIPHELMHILIFQATKQNFQKVPAWLSEGLATYSETYPNPELGRALADAAATNSLIPFESLCQAFPREAQSSLLAYAESLSMVKYLESKYGKTLFVQMLDASGQGLSCAQLVKNTTGISLDLLEREWAKTLIPGTMMTPVSKILISVIGGTILIGMIIYLAGRKKRTQVSTSDGKID